MTLKARYEDYTEAEFLAFLQEFYGGAGTLEGDEYGEYIGGLGEHFATVTEHPGKCDLIFHPPADMEDSPNGVLAAIKSWRAANGKPGFKSD